MRFIFTHTHGVHAGLRQIIGVWDGPTLPAYLGPFDLIGPLERRVANATLVKAEKAFAVYREEACIGCR